MLKKIFIWLVGIIVLITFLFSTLVVGFFLKIYFQEKKIENKNISNKEIFLNLIKE